MYRIWRRLCVIPFFFHLLPSHLSKAAAAGKSPASQAVGNVGGIASCAAEAVVEVVVINGAAVVETGGSVE